MRRGEKGFSIIEMALACSISALLAAAAGMTILQAAKSASGSKAHLSVVSQVHSAGYWIGRDALMAESIIVDNLEYPNLLVLSWSEQDLNGGDTVYHTVTYSLENLSGNVGDLKRNHRTTTGIDEDTLVARYIYYDAGDPQAGTSATFQTPVLTLRLHAVFDGTTETRQYTFDHRPDFMQ